MPAPFSAAAPVLPSPPLRYDPEEQAQFRREVERSIRDTKENNEYPALYGEIYDNGGAVLNVRHPKFGATGNGTTDDTAAFEAAIALAGAAGGGKIVVPPGAYVISELDIDYKNVLIEGMTSGYGYEPANKAVTLSCTTGVYAVHLKYTSASRNAQFSGLKNLSVSGTTEYGVVTSSGMTILSEVNIEGFQYGSAIVAAGNSNIFKRCSFLGASRAGLVVTGENDAQNAYLHPNLTFTALSNTQMHFTDCNFRSNEFGIIMRNCVNTRFENCAIESNTQAGLIAYQSDNGSVTGLNFDNCWFENNYVAYTSGSASFSIAGINVLLIGVATPITWTSNVDAGYQIWISSQTGGTGAGPGANFMFNRCHISGASGSAQRYVRIRRARFVKFIEVDMLGGDSAEPLALSLESEASYCHFWDVNGGVALIAAGEGNRTMVIRSQTGTNEALGGLAIDQGGISAQRLSVFETAGDARIYWSAGTGTPENAVAANIGSLFSRVDGGGGTSLYVKETGTGVTGWVAK